jgi:cytoskeletal protein CcmA (bactofilin family)
LTEKADTESIVIDPVAMNIVNRVAPGCRQSGVFYCEGGLMVEGTIEGDIQVIGGPLVLMPEGVIAGKITGNAEAYLFGTIRARSDTELSELDMGGAVFLTETLRAQANITAGAIKSYEGAQVEGRIKTVKRAAF